MRHETEPNRHTPFLALLAITSLAVLLLAPQPAAAATDYCAWTAHLAANACRNEVWDDFWTATGQCINLTDPVERRECHDDAGDEANEAWQECHDQRAARMELCDELGPDRYDPDFDPEDFTTEFANLNPYFPLAVGNQWEYEGGDEVIEVEVLDETKLIEEVTCIVVRDVVSEDGTVIEDTDDWYGQAENGDVYYCGEISQDYELFDGDDPEIPELVAVEGSWKTGRDGAVPGIVMFGAPQEGTVYRQEVSLGDAEDAAEILTTTYSYGDDPELDELVPEELADLLCDGDCLVTREFTPLDPDVEELKYYAPGVGLFLEVNPEEEEIVQLVACNVDPRCASLPAP